MRYNLIVLFVFQFLNQILGKELSGIPLFYNFDLNRYEMNLLRLNLVPKLAKFVNFKNQNEGSTFAVLCSVEEGSTPLFFEWTKNGQTIKSSSHYNYKIENSKTSSTLNIEGVVRTDSGNYSCIAKNSFGSD